MRFCDATDRPPLTVDALVQGVRSTFRGLPDVRKGGNNPRYTMEDTGLAAFSVFFTQSPSFLDDQTRM